MLIIHQGCFGDESVLVIKVRVEREFEIVDLKGRLVRSGGKTAVIHSDTSTDGQRAVGAKV